MAKVKVGPGGIETISGAIKKPKKSEGHNHGNYVIITHRTAATENPNCQRFWVRDADGYTRSTQPSSRELNARARFTDVAALVKARKADLTKIAQDQAAFVAQKDTAGGKKTMKAYLWYICGQQYDANQG